MVGISFVALLAAPAVVQPAAPRLVDFAKAYYQLSLPIDWDGLEKLPGATWAALPATSLKNCLPNGDCHARQGRATLGGQPMTLVATGARTMVVNILIRNTGKPIGEAAVLAELAQAGLTTTAARCPLRPGGTTWYRLGGVGIAPGYLSVQPAAAGRPGEGFVLSQGQDLPALPPNQLAQYSESCEAGAERKPVSTLKPHQLLADLVVSLLAPSSAGYDWKTLRGLPTQIAWIGDAPKPTDLSFKNDRNPLSLTGEVRLAGRQFSVLASGTADRVNAVYLDEGGLHPRGEHMLGVVYERGIAVRLVRCGPVYTESTNNWYSLESAKTKPAMILQSIRYDGNQVQEAYALRLDGSLPPRDPRDRNPGTNGC